MAEAFADAGVNDDWTAIGYPNPQGEPVVSLLGQSYVILESDTETQIAAWLLIRYLTSPESQIKLAQSGLYLPLDRNVATELQEDTAFPSAWRDALALLDQAVVEPYNRHWGGASVPAKYAQSEVLDERFVPGTMALFLDQLDKMVDDLESE